jgi:Flp pilus assembly pilin Flp
MIGILKHGIGHDELQFRAEMPIVQQGAKTLMRFLAGEEGQDLIEYSLLLAFLALGTIALLTSARTSLNGLWGTVSRSLNTANAAAAS